MDRACHFVQNPGMPRPASPPSPLSLQLLRANCHRIDRDWGNFRMVYWFWRVYLTDQPGAVIRTDAREWRLRPGVMLLIPAGLPFQPSCHRARMALYSIHFDLPALPAASCRSLFPVPWAFAPPHSGTLASLPEAIRDGCRERLEHPVQRQELLGWLHLLFAERLRALPADRQEWLAQLQNRRHRLTAALALIEQSYASRLTADSIAAVLHLSPDHTCRLFREWLGMSPMQYLEEVRMQTACRLLLESEETIESIAEATGYHDRYYFSRVFKRRFQLGPATFRRRAGRAPG